MFDLVLAAGILLLAGLIAAHFNSSPAVEASGAAHVVDGDTLEVAHRRIRLVGLDAPELHQACEINGSRYPCGKQARMFLEDMTRGHTISCRGREFDRYRRLLAVCHAGKADLNARMVFSGWAVSYGGYHREEREARENRRGIWAGQFERPQDWRKN